MALTREQFNKLRASGLSTEQIINFERGYVPEKKETFLQGLGRDIASPFVRGAELVGSAASLTGSSVKALYQNKTGQQEQAKKTMSEALKKAQDRTTAKVNVFGREEAPITTTKQAVGAGLEVGANFIGGGAAKNVFQNGIRTGIKTLAKQGAKAGLASGSMYGAGTALKENGNFGDVLKSSAIGGATGLVGGAVLAPVIGLGEKAAYRLTNTGIKAIKNVAGQINKKIKGVVTADDIEKELFNIENNYAKTRKMNSFSKDGGSETRKRLVSADVLSNVVDDTGTIRTLGENGAKAQYKLKTIDGTEGLVKEILVKEGKTVSPEVLEGKMINDIMNSGLEGRALKTSLNNVNGEIEGLMLRATPDGQIPLDVIHDAKISTAELAFKNLDPGIKKEGKSFAGSYKRIIEETSDEPIEAINKELQKDYKVLELLDVLDGKKVKGGKLGKYFAQIGGNIVGGAAGSVGGPVGSAAGTIIGGEIAGKIKGQMLKNTFGQSIGSTIEKSGILVEASNKVKAPRLLLPAPKPGSHRSSLGSGPTINLPSKTQSTLDNAYSYNLGKRNTMYNTPNTTIKKPIKLKSNNKTSSITPVNKKVKPLPKSKGETLKTTPSKLDPKNFKTAEDYVKAHSLYHGTPNKLIGGKLTFGAGNQLKKGGYMGGHFLTDTPEIANNFSFGGKVYQASSEIKNKVLDVNKNKKLFENYIGKSYTSDGEKLKFTQQDFDSMFPNGKADWATINTDLVEQLSKKLGKIGVAIPEYAGGKQGMTYQLFQDNIPVKTKSQLISEWNKAQPLKSDLVQQAKKYKSAEEFVKAQGKPIFHGSSKEKANLIRRDGFKLPKSIAEQTDRPVYGDGVYFSNKRSGAYDNSATGENTIEGYLPKDINLYKTFGEKEAFNINTESLKKKGFDGVEVTFGSGEKHFVIFDPTKIKTRENFISIYDKANNTVTKDIPVILRPLNNLAKRVKTLEEFKRKANLDGNIVKYISENYSGKDLDSQLTDIWNKANKTPLKSNLETEAKKIPLYHGTPNKFLSFDVNKMTTGNTGKGIYLTSDKNAGKYYGRLSAEEMALKNSKDLEIPKIKEPVVMEIILSNDAKIKKFNKFPTDKEVELAKQGGFDGISYPDDIIKNTQGIPYLPKNANTIMMFKPDKIKIKNR